MQGSLTLRSSTVVAALGAAAELVVTLTEAAVIATAPDVTVLSSFTGAALAKRKRNSENCHSLWK